jgi:hypothetical protein
MRAAKRFQEFRMVQRESRHVAAVLRKALFARRSLESPSPEQGGFSKQPPAWKGLREESPSPSGGDHLPLDRAEMPLSIRDNRPCAGTVTDRRHLTLASYFLHCG